MYRPPENSNRVKSIKSKFENIDDSSAAKPVRNGARSNLTQKDNLTRQLSDPARRNIKRTPAFRFDAKPEKPFQRNNSLAERDPTTVTSAVKPDCDNKRTDFVRPVLIKSKSSTDFQYIRSKFDKKPEEKKNVNIIKQENQRNEDKSRILSLYTEPIPKSQRNSNNNSNNNNNTIYNATTLKISEQQTIFTDSLKAVLKRPLPNGPAPQKPPRTFEHNQKKSEPNVSFLHKPSMTPPPQNKITRTPNGHKHDPRYMLNKLENALRNNKLKIKHKSKLEASATSGEDSDDSVLFKSKTNRDLPSLPSSPSDTKISCFDGLGLCKPTYERIREPDSVFFVDRKQKEEPVYTEPYNLVNEQYRKEVTRNSVSKNSLYYLSTPLLTDMGRSYSVSMDDTLPIQGNNGTEDLLSKQFSAENSSLSSFTSASDAESAASTPLEETKSLDNHQKIKDLINSFETKQLDSSPPSKPTQVEGTFRLEELKLSLQKTIETCFDNEPTEPKAKSTTSVDTIVSKFQTYVKTMPKYKCPRYNLEDRIFYCCLVVGWDGESPQIKFKFPPNANIPERMADLCYPEAAGGPLDISDNAQCYSLVLTNDKGERTFGYCRRVIPEGSTRCIPLAYCILSKNRAPRFYKKILIELESRHGVPDKLRDELISEFYFKKFPKPGESIRINLTNMMYNLHKVKNEIMHNDRKPEISDPMDLNSFVHVSTGYGTLNTMKRSNVESFENIIIGRADEKICSTSPSVIVENNGSAELILTLHHDSRYEEADLKPLHKLPPDILLKIFASLLLERKVILISCVISKLSCCVDALQSILYPFSWPHTFIPILPQCLWDVVESPTPVICGILSVSIIDDYKIEHGIVVDLDSGKILIEEGDENSILSDSMKKSWYQGFALAKTIPPEDYVHSVYLSDAYLKVFIASLKHYKNHITDNTFDKETFIRSGKTRGIRRFLKWFTETSMFMSFIDTVLINSDSFSLFDKKIEMYGSDDSNAILTKLMDWKK